MPRAICLLMLILPSFGLSAAEKTTVVGRQAHRQISFGPGLETKVEGLVVALLGSCSAENGAEIANKERWDKALKGAHLRITFAKPRLFSVNAEESDLNALEILVPIDAAQSPDHIFVRNGDRYRAFAKYEPDVCRVLMKQLEGLPLKKKEP